jgi:hypothetical protein
MHCCTYSGFIQSLWIQVVHIIHVIMYVCLCHLLKQLPLSSFSYLATLPYLTTWKGKMVIKSINLHPLNLHYSSLFLTFSKWSFKLEFKNYLKMRVHSINPDLFPQPQDSSVCRPIAWDNLCAIKFHSNVALLCEVTYSTAYHGIHNLVIMRDNGLICK